MRWEMVFRALVAAAIGVGGIVVAFAMWDSYTQFPDGLGGLVTENLPDSGVDHSVTAVLLNFRAYDTFLEIIVLTVAFWGTWSLRIRDEPGLSNPPELLLDRVSTVLIPTLILLAIYLLWAGSHRPGGEFQAGAVLGAAGILSLLVGQSIPGAHHSFFRHLLVILGGAVFLLAGAVGWLLSGDFFGYYPGSEGAMILLIEAAAAISIGFILVALFAGSVTRFSGDVEEPVEVIDDA